MIKFIRYVHHELPVMVREDLKGKHRDHCLCYSCLHFKPNQDDNCWIAEQVYRLCVEHDLVLPVWECPIFVLSQETRDKYLRIDRKSEDTSQDA